MLKDFDDRSEERARHLLEVVSAEARDQPRPLPTALAERLRTIPRREISCDAVERLYLASLGRTADSVADDLAAGDPAAERHLESCPRCRQLYAPLRAVAVQPPRRIPPRLGERLRAIPRQPRPAWWVRDSRYAAAVCLLTAGLLTATGSLQAEQLIDATRGAGQRTGEWITSSRQESAGITQKLGSGIDTALAKGQAWLQGAGSVWGNFVETTGEQLRRMPAMLDVEPSPNAGDSNGTDDRDPSQTPRP